MKSIQVYYNKIEAILNKRKASGKSTKAKSSAGLLAPSKSTPTKPDTAGDDPKELKLIADFVEGIRSTRDEVLNGRK
jgi:hypothetical protein